MIIRPETVSYRIKRGTGFADIPSNPPPPLAELDSPFQYAEYLSLKVRHDTHDIEGLVKVPVSENEDGSPTASGSNGPRKGNEKDLWVYEHLRRLPIDLTPLVTLLLGTCTAETCPTMKADQWQYLCVAHGSEGAEECSAIDYILHTLDSTTSLLNSSETFPSRIQIPSASLAHFPSLFRRLSRIFSHAYYHHREIFSLAEAETSLCARFWALCERYDLVNTKLLIIPREVVAASIDGTGPTAEDYNDDDDDDEDEEDEDEDADADDGRDSRRREKGEGGPRPHSLDRHARPHKLDDLRQKGEGTVKQWANPTPLHSYSPVTAATKTETTDENNATAPVPAETETEAPISINAKDDESLTKASNARTLGRSTLGRKVRGTMLWTSDSSDPVAVPPLPSTPEATSAEGAPLERTESIETAVLVDEDPSQLQPLDIVSAPVEDEPDVPEPVVPKDEIELLEEEGKIPPISSVSPLPPPSANEVPPGPEADQTKESEEMHEVPLNEKGPEEVAAAESGSKTDATDTEATDPEPVAKDELADAPSSIDGETEEVKQ